MRKALEPQFKENGFSKSEGSCVDCELEMVTLVLRKKLIIYGFRLLEESSTDFFFKLCLSFCFLNFNHVCLSFLDYYSLSML